VGLLQAADLGFANRGNRFEGTREVRIAGAPPLEVLSFLREPAQLRPNRDGMIPLRFFLPAAATVRLRSSELVIDRYYEMVPTRTRWDAGWNLFAPWPAGEVLGPLSVRTANLGVVATVSPAGATTELIPVLGAPGVAGLSSHTYAFVFRTREDLRKADWSLRPEAEKAATRQGSLQAVIGGAPVAIAFDLGGAPDGYYRVYIDGRYEGQSGGPEFEFRFYHRAGLPDEAGGQR
jgi:hypothetical protein